MEFPSSHASNGNPSGEKPVGDNIEIKENELNPIIDENKETREETVGFEEQAEQAEQEEQAVGFEERIKLLESNNEKLKEKLNKYNIVMKITLSSWINPSIFVAIVAIFISILLGYFNFISRMDSLTNRIDAIYPSPASEKTDTTEVDSEDKNTETEP